MPKYGQTDPRFSTQSPSEVGSARFRPSNQRSKCGLLSNNSRSARMRKKPSARHWVNDNTQDCATALNKDVVVCQILLFPVAAMATGLH